MPGPEVSVFHTHPHSAHSNLVEHMLVLFYKGENWSVPQQAVQGPAAGTQHRQGLHPGLSDGEVCLYNSHIKS